MKTAEQKEMYDFEMAFIDKLIADGVETCLSTRRYRALECRFGGYRSCDCVRKTCIWLGGTYHWAEKCYGLKWAAVHGSKAICVVIKHNDLDMARVGPFLKGDSKEMIMFSLTAAIISEIGDLPDELHEQSIRRPFGVVSVNHFQKGSGHEASSAEYDEKKAIEVLYEKMKRSCSEYTWGDTIQTTISAFQHLCPEELTAEDIFVCVCQDIEMAPYYLRPNVIKDFMKTCSS